MAKINPATIALFDDHSTRRRRVLVLPRLLNDAAEKQYHRDLGEDFDNAHNIIKKWADLETKGKLVKKEVSLDANFLNDIFGQALRYTPIENSSGSYLLDRQLHVPGVGSADGAIGLFPVADKNAPNPIAVIELKSADCDLDTDKSNGRTAVQQLFDYLNALPETQWGIVSNFKTIRLYHKSRGTQAYEIFTLQKLRILDHFKNFWCLLERGGLIKSKLNQVPRADILLNQTGERQKTVGDILYNFYSIHRSNLIAVLRDDFNKPLDESIRIAQKIFDRIIFVAFCESRGLIRKDSIQSAIKNIPPFTRVKNPRWQSLINLFYGIDKGHPDLDIDRGYNGGLFAADDAIDSLQLPDEPWSTVFAEFGKYDFKDEVNVDVLGHIFERSITELEKMRLGGLFAKTAAPAGSSQPRMLKSAERKKFGIYYTPPEFTSFIVRQTLGELLDQRFSEREKALGVTPEELEQDYAGNSPRLKAYYLQCLEILSEMKVIDPACGSGAFLIAAYELLDDYYDNVIRHLAALEHPGAQELLLQIPTFILNNNLFGVDLSEEAVEITRLALWIRSARPHKTLADLSHNILCGNSLVEDPAVHPRALNWRQAFPDVFNRKIPGFDAVIGNPPWERLKLQEREFFAFSDPDIAGAVNAATRRKLIEQLETRNPETFKRYRLAQSLAETTSAHVRSSGRFPLTGKGDVNTYMLFAELARTLVASTGRVGLLVPSGIATDNTTKEYFAELINSQLLIKLFDFENRLGIFPDVDGRFKFCTLIFGGADAKTPNADFVFFAHTMEDLEQKNRHITLSKKDIALLNPNTRTCPIFRTRRDAEITKDVYRRIPVLIDESRKEGGSPWGVQYLRMLDQTNDAELFVEPAQAAKDGFKLAGNIFQKGKEKLLPLYEAKMVQAFDHRAASVEITAENWMRQAQTVETTLVEHQNPEFSAISRWWVNAANLPTICANRPYYLAFKDISSSTNQRTMIASAIPAYAAHNHLVLMFTNYDVIQEMCLLGNLNSFAFDYITRQKLGAITLNYFIVNQLPILPPDAYQEKCPWAKKQTLEQWISERVLKLTCTANDMIPLARACDFNPPSYVWKWKEQERQQLRAQLDAAYFILYGLSREDVVYVLSTFQAAGDPADPASAAGQILEFYDQYIQ